MSLNVEFRIRVGPLDDLNDLTDRCQGFTIDQTVSLSQISVHSANLTFENFDGALTPNAGGTYDSIDWFACAVLIDFKVTQDVFNLWRPLYHGIVDNFELRDDGTVSIVNLSCLDWITVLGRAQADFTYSTPATLTSMINNTVSAVATELPLLGAVGTPTVNESIYANSTVNAVSDIDGFIADALNTLMAGAHCAAFATEMGEGEYSYIIHGNNLTFTSADFTTITLVESEPTSGELPFVSLEVGYNTRDLVNVTTIQRDGGTAQVATDTASKQLYGARNYQATGGLLATDADCLTAAQQRTNRQSTVRFVPRNVTLTSPNWSSAPDGSAANLIRLLRVESLAMYPLQLEYTPAGTSTLQTEHVVTTGRTISAVPGRMSVTFQLLSSVDYQSFVLDSSTLGVLDQNRLG